MTDPYPPHGAQVTSKELDNLKAALTRFLSGTSAPLYLRTAAAPLTQAS